MEFKDFIKESSSDEGKKLEFYRKEFPGIRIYSRESVKNEINIRKYSSFYDDKNVVFWTSNHMWKIIPETKKLYKGNLYLYELSDDVKYKKIANKLGLTFYYINYEGDGLDYGLFLAFKKRSTSKYVKQLQFESVDTDFKVGDRVIAIKNFSSKIVAGIKGKVVRVGYYSICVYWDKHIDGHDCGGNCKSGYGWNVPVSYVKKISTSRFVKQLDFK